MVTSVKVLQTLFLLFFFFALSVQMVAQEGYSSAAMSMSQAKSGEMIIPKPGEVIEEEYFNYHIHQLPRPSQQQAAHLDAQWIGVGLDSYLVQIGLSTLRLEEMPVRQGVNVALVVDKSGSMGYGEKLVKTKQAMLAFVDQLQAEDRLSIVTFDHTTAVAFPCQPLGDKVAVRNAINNIELGGSTNMPAGIQLGYKTLLGGVEAGRDNRMIILTDALTNTGVINPEEIVKGTDGYRAEVELSYSMIGVGIDFNYELTRLMTANGRDQVHFISSPDDIQKVFVQEVESLLYPIGRRPQLRIQLPQGLRMKKVFGYSPNVTEQSADLDLRDFNAGLSQIVLLQVEGAARLLPRMAVDLSYQQPGQGAQVQMQTKVMEARPVNDIQKNYAIARMAASLRKMAEYYQQGKATEAEDILDVQIGEVKRDFPAPRDPDITRMLDILENYRKNVRRLAGH